jgi:hypothetical protein
MSVTIGRTTVRFDRKEEDPRQYVITVQVLSEKRKGLKGDVKVDPLAATSVAQLAGMVEAAGGAAAEYLGENYNDNIDPSQCARDAVKAFGEECRMMAELKKDLPDKVKRLEFYAGMLTGFMTDAEQELLKRIVWSVNHDVTPPTQEIQWVNEKVAQLQGYLV